MSLTASTKISSSDGIGRWMTISLLAIVMGIIGGLFAALLRFLIESITWFFYEFLLQYIQINVGNYNIGIIFLPVIGGLIVGFIIFKYAIETKGSGIPYLLESMTMKGAHMSPRIGVFKTIVSSITIGSGGSAGREGPIAMISASFGSFFGKQLKLKPEDKRLLMTCGLAAGIAGSFNSPIGGALFGLEILYQGVTIIAAIPVFLSSVIGTLIAGNIYGFDPIFSISVNIAEINAIEYPFFIIIGVICGVVAYYRHKFYSIIEKMFNRFPISNYLKPAIGGLFVGIIIMLLPHNGLYGSGFEGIQLALDNQLGIGLLFLLCFLKILATAFTIGSGGSGGVFAPLLYIGCMLGGGFGLLFKLLFPSIISTPIIYCLIGAAALFAASAQAPLNISIMVAEMTKHFDVFPPLLIASVSSFLVGHIFFKGSSIYTLILKDRGVDLQSDTVYILNNVRVNEIMASNVMTVSPDLPILELAQLSFQHNHLNQFPVINFGQLEGMAFIDSLYSIPYEDWDNSTVREILVKENVFITSKSLLQEALDIMNEFQYTALVVVDYIENEKGIQERNLRGIITINDIIRVWKQTKK